MFQIHLTGAGMSQRAVRYEVLSSPQVESAESTAAHEVTKDSTMGEYNNAVTRLGLEMMVCAVSSPTTKEKLPEAKWTTVDAKTLSMTWGQYFNVKDTAALKALYVREHTVTQSDIDAIMEGKLAVLEG